MYPLLLPVEVSDQSHCFLYLLYCANLNLYCTIFDYVLQLFSALRVQYSILIAIHFFLKQHFIQQIKPSSAPYLVIFLICTVYVLVYNEYEYIGLSLHPVFILQSHLPIWFNMQYQQVQ